VLTPYSVSESIRVKWTHDHRLLHLALIVLGALGSLYFLIFFIEDWHWIAIAALLTFLYSAPKVPMPAFAWLRKIAIGKTIFLSFVWTYVTSVLPIALSHSAFGNREVLFCLSRFFLIYPICILFDYRDRENDKQEGIRSMITYLGEGGISRLFYFSLLVFLLSTMALYTGKAFQLCRLSICCFPELSSPVFIPIPGEIFPTTISISCWMGS
jgi:4-hydroxybenzoate polyprenyltransferase